MHRKYHEKFKILDILAVTTQAREGIETKIVTKKKLIESVTTQAREGIETDCQEGKTALFFSNNSSP